MHECVPAIASSLPNTLTLRAFWSVNRAASLIQRPERRLHSSGQGMTLGVDQSVHVDSANRVDATEVPRWTPKSGH